MAPKRKPMLPSTSDIAFADSLMANAHVEGVVEVDELSPKLRAAFGMLGELTETMTELRTEQPRRMDPYAEEFMRMFLDAGLDMEQAGTLLGGFFSSTLLARILGDVAAGNLDPVVAVPRARAPKVKEAEEPVAPVAPVAPVEPAPPAKAKRTPRKKVEPVPEPVSAPVDEETADAVKRMIEDSSVPVTPSLSTTPDDEHVNPADLDELASLPEVTPPDPAPVAPVAPPVPQVPLTPFDSEPNPDF